MSYDIFLADRVTGKVVDLPFAHVMTGGRFKAKYDPITGIFTPMPTREAWLNVTWNYGPYYYESARLDERFGDAGIRGIYGKTGLESIPMLNGMIENIMKKYKDKNGEWITTTREKTFYFNFEGAGVSFEEYINAIPRGEMGKYYTEKGQEDVWEGDTEDYWKATAANAIKPLYQLIAMAKLRPDCVWNGD